VIGVQVWYEDSAQFLQNADNVCAAEMSIQLTESVLSTVKQHAVTVTANIT